MQQLHHYYEQHGHPIHPSEQSCNTTTTDSQAHCTNVNADAKSSCPAATSDELNTLLAAANAYNEREDEWAAFSTALLPITSPLGPRLGQRLSDILVKLSQVQAELLILGRVGNKASVDLKKLSGMAYLSGNDPWYVCLYSYSYTYKLHIIELYLIY